MNLPDKAAAYRALESHDARFDGLIFVGVKSTGIYCRPVCPARTPKYENCTFYDSAAAAQEAGYRPCLRCRPETAPQLSPWRGTSNTVSRALTLIAEGALDGENSSVDRLAARLGMGERQLRRLFLQQLGVSPISVAQTRRVLFAKQLIHDTNLPMTEVALAAGFTSLRRFNEVFQNLFHRPPSSLRREAGTDIPDSDGGTTLRIRYRPPYDWNSMLNFLAARAIPGVEVVNNGLYRRTIEIDGKVGTISVKHLPQRQSLCLTIHFPLVQAFPGIVNRVRRLFDLGANIETINEHLFLDEKLAPLIARRPGLRTPGGWDGFELAVRAVLGQQVSVAAARRLAGQLVQLHGRGLPNDVTNHDELTHCFPTAECLVNVPSLGLGMPIARLNTLKAVAQAAVANSDLFRSSRSIDEAVSHLRRIPGIGEWTAQYIALRALREVDAFPASDIGLLRGARKIVGEPVTPQHLLQWSELWRPWRAYAAQHLWAADADCNQASQDSSA
ncbi:AlkA N-terminal domain-containing protein [Edaphobacter modestus]|uniref:DNA-3-methyladenine glycosylase II n=1 Tax=Edaphobacter modestus TaxID=388466 RepID=A0A4Q7YYD2_9BACT|nr:AlkA N-terminal domain-containing protein [Edaphobacter modestus]RZU42165.1 DNA-3-methyladenine glycosylase II [Edaphobacter modestus]